MSYITTSFREFVKDKLIQETNKENSPVVPHEKIKIKSDKDWLKELNEEWDKIMGGRD